MAHPQGGPFVFSVLVGCAAAPAAQGLDGTRLSRGAREGGDEQEVLPHRDSLEGLCRPPPAQALVGLGEHVDPLGRIHDAQVPPAVCPRPCSSQSAAARTGTVPEKVSRLDRGTGGPDRKVASRGPGIILPGSWSSAALAVGGCIPDRAADSGVSLPHEVVPGLRTSHSGRSCSAGTGPRAPPASTSRDVVRQSAKVALDAPGVPTTMSVPFSSTVVLATESRDSSLAAG